MKRLLSAGLIAATLSGCGAGPRPELPSAAAVEAPAQWRDSLPGMPIEERWWQAFGDPVLDALVTRAIAQNTNIALAAQRVAEARAQAALAEAQRAPTISAVVPGLRERDVSPLGIVQTQSAAQPQIIASYDLDLFGRLRSASEAARAQLLATQAGQENVRLAVISGTVQTYIGLRALDRQLEILRVTLVARAEQLRLARRQAEAGYTSALQLTQAEAEYRATEQLIPPTELAIRRQENALSILLGETPGDVTRGVPLGQISPPGLPDRLPSELLRRRPDILQAEQQIVAADRSLDSARAAFMPDINLTDTAGFVASTLLPNAYGIFSVGGSILAPIFQGGRLRAQADIAAARRDEAAFAYRETVLVAFQEVENARAAITATTRQEEVLVAQRDVLDRAFTLASNRYRAGYATYLDQLDAQRNLLSAELGIAQARGARLQATVQLFQALGGAWTVPWDAAVTASRP